MNSCILEHLLTAFIACCLAAGVARADVASNAPSPQADHPRTGGKKDAGEDKKKTGQEEEKGEDKAKGKADEKKKGEPGQEGFEPSGMPALRFKMKDIDGKEVDLIQYYGKVVLMVNTASKCGYTPQYAALQELYDIYVDRQFVILAFPSNDFGNQEPGTNADVKKFCEETYHIKFPLFAKVSVKGPDICPLYKYLTAKDAGHKFGGEIKWNFTKFLINRKGEIVARFQPADHPTKSKKMREAIEKALEEPIPVDSPFAPKETLKPSMRPVVRP